MSSRSLTDRIGRIDRQRSALICLQWKRYGQALSLGIALTYPELLHAQLLLLAPLPDAPRQAECAPRRDTAPPLNVAEAGLGGANALAPPQQSSPGVAQPGVPGASPQAPVESPVPLALRLDVPPETLQCLPEFSSLANARICCNPAGNPFASYLSSLSVPLTAKDTLLLAERNIRDPYNLLTVGGEAAISIGSDAHTPYGPGFPGFARYAGVSLTQEMVGQFLGTFLIPSLTHQSPFYRREPNLPIKRRIVHVFAAVLLSQSDEDVPMFNYATVFGTIGTSALGNLYVPGRKTSWGASADRVAVALATDPIGNVVAEFLPDVARRININVVLVQRVINRIDIEEGVAPP